MRTLIVLLALLAALPARAERVPFNLHALNFTAAAAEALVTLTPQRYGVNGSTGTSFAVTAGKRLRLTGISVCTKNAGAAVQNVIVRVRVNVSGAATASSPLVAFCGVATTTATAGITACNFCPIDASGDGVAEFMGDDQIGVGQVGSVTAGNDVILYGVEL